MKAEIIRNLVKSVFKVDISKVLLCGDLRETFETENNTASGNAYNYNKKNKLYAYYPKRGFIEVKGDMNGYSQNANGTQNKEYRILFEHTLEHKEALFFIHHYSNNSWQEGKGSWQNESWTIYKAPDFDSIVKKTEIEEMQKWNNFIKH